MRILHRGQGRAARVALRRRFERLRRGTVLRQARWRKAAATGLLPAAMIIGQVFLRDVAGAAPCDSPSTAMSHALPRDVPNFARSLPEARMVLASGFTLGWRSVLVTVIVCGLGDDPLSRLTIMLSVRVVGGAGSLALSAQWSGWVQ